MLRVGSVRCEAALRTERGSRADEAEHTPPEGRRERRSRELRDRIYRSAQKLFLEQGFENTTVTQIADAADIAPATFFNHFQSKSAVLDEVTAEVFGYLQQILDKELSRPGTTVARLEGFAKRVASEILMVRSVAHDTILGMIQSGIRQGEITPYTRKIRTPFALLFREGQENGEVRTDLDADFLAEVVIGALNAAVINWLGEPDYPLAKRLLETARFMGEAIQAHTPARSHN